MSMSSCSEELDRRPVVLGRALLRGGVERRRLQARLRPQLPLECFAFGGVARPATALASAAA